MMFPHGESATLFGFGHGDSAILFEFGQILSRTVDDLNVNMMPFTQGNVYVSLGFLVYRNS